MDPKKVNIQVEKALLYHFTFHSRKRINFENDYQWIENGKILSSDLNVFSSHVHHLLPSGSELELVRKSYLNAYEKRSAMGFSKRS